MEGAPFVYRLCPSTPSLAAIQADARRLRGREQRNVLVPRLAQAVKKTCVLARITETTACFPIIKVNEKEVRLVFIRT